jgi:hypothetical protein
MPRRKKIKAVLYLYQEQIRALKKKAESVDQPMSKLIRDAVDQYLKADR